MRVNSTSRCLYCGSVFTLRRYWQRYCGDECRYTHHNKYTNGSSMTKQQASTLVEDRHPDPEFLREMQKIARLFAINSGSVCIDDLRAYACELQPAHPSLWGKIFRSSEWECIGRKASTFKSNHGRKIKIWKLK